MSLHCPICLSEYRDPRLLPCSHTFCFECISTLVDKNPAIHCPLCREEISLPPSGASSFKKNIYIGPLMETMTKVNRISEAGQKCSLHPTKALEFFCDGRQCKKAVCAMCVITTHQGADHVLKEMPEEMIMEVKKQAATLMEITQSALHSVGEYQHNLDSKMGEAERELQRALDVLRKIESQVKLQLARVLEEKGDILTKQRTSLERRHRDLSRLLESCTNPSSVAEIPTYADQLASIKAAASDLRAAPFEDVHFGTEVYADVADITTLVCCVQKFAKRSLPIDKSVTDALRGRVPRILGNSCLQSPRAICTVDADSYVIADHAAKCVYRVRLDDTRPVLLLGSEGCFAESVCMYNGDYIITSYNDSTVKRVGRNPWTITGGQFSQPWGLAVLPDRSGVVVSEYGRHRLQIINPDTGATIAVIGNETIFKHPMGLAFDRYGNLVVADWGLSQVKVITLSGVLLMTLGGKGSGIGQLDLPYDVALDPDGNIFVADYNNSRLSVFRSDGTPLEPVPTSSKPFSVNVSNGRMLAGLATGEIVVFN